MYELFFIRKNTNRFFSQFILSIVEFPVQVLVCDQCLVRNSYFPLKLYIIIFSD